MYMPGFFRTASKPSSLPSLEASYFSPESGMVDGLSSETRLVSLAWAAFSAGSRASLLGGVSIVSFAIKMVLSAASQVALDLAVKYVGKSPTAQLLFRGFLAQETTISSGTPKQEPEGI